MPVIRETGAGLRVLHVITDRDRRGAQVFAVDLADGLQAIGLENEVVALSSGRHGDLLQIQALGRTRRSFHTFHELRRRAHDADVVVAHGSATLLACSVALLGTRTPFLYRQISDPLHWAASWPRRLRVAVMLRRSSGIVALSSGVADVFAARYGIPRGEITVLPNAAPARRFRPPTPSERAVAREQLGLDVNDVVATYIGALAVEKGVDDLVDAARSVPGVRVLVVGDGPERERIAHRAAELRPCQLLLTGPLADPLPALHATDVLVLPSRGGDSMPAVLIEAGLCGLPTISTPVGAIPDVVVDGETGLLAPAADVRRLTAALRHLSSEPETRASMGAEARRRCEEHFSIEGTAPGWKQVLTSVA